MLKWIGRARLDLYRVKFVWDFIGVIVFGCDGNNFMALLFEVLE